MFGCCHGDGKRMMERMFVGAPEGMHDRLLDHSRALTGTTFCAVGWGAGWAWWRLRDCFLWRKLAV